MSTNHSHHHRLARVLAGSLAVAAFAAPVAAARPMSVTYGSGTSAQTIPPPPTVTRTVDDGFDWGSAAIGAGGAGAALLLGAAAAAAASQRHRRVNVSH